MRRADNKAIARAFRAALHYLVAGKEQFLCFALDRAARDGACSGDARYSAVKVIEQRLEGRYTVIDWLQALGHLDYHPPLQQRQEYRIRWCASLIKEFENA